jgi:predicted lipid-binding transport protein (Tim44 family)
VREALRLNFNIVNGDSTMALDLKALAAKAQAQATASAEPVAQAGNKPQIGQNGKPIPQVYGNIGIAVAMPDGTKKFLSTNIGAPIDTAERLQSSDNSRPEWKDEAEFANGFQDMLKSIYDTLGEGETYLLENITLEIRRRKPKGEAATTGANPYMAALASMLPANVIPAE